jgi:hypothetical protein
MDPMYLPDSGYYGQQFQTVDNSESGYHYDQDQITSGGWLAAGLAAPSPRFSHFKRPASYDVSQPNISAHGMLHIDERVYFEY